MYFKLLAYLGRYKKQAILSPIAVTGEVILEIYIPFLMAKIVDVGIAQKDLKYVVETGLLMIGAALLSLACGSAAARFAAVAATGFSKEIRKAVFNKIQDFSFSNTDKFSTASLITRLTTDITFVQNSFMMIIRALVRSPLMLISATLMAVRINSELALVFLVAIPFLGTALAVMSIKAHPYFLKMFEKYDAINSSLQEMLTAVRVVKAFVREEYENKKFNDAVTDLKNAQKTAEKIVILNMPVMNFAMQACLICIVWFGGNLIVQGKMQTGELFSFLTYIGMILMSLMMISMVFIGIIISQASAKRICEVLSEIPGIKDTGKDGLVPQDGSIIFENVSFSYSGRAENLTLKDISLNIRSGETIGVIGATGASKTTFVQLIPRLYEAFSGRILIGGHEIAEYHLPVLRSAVAMVLQNNLLFSGTIADNLRWGDETASMEELQAACQAAQAHEFILSFPQGYDTVLGQGGVNVSGGQKQRLCLARALLKKPKILILDDSTSAVDTATDQNIRTALKDQLKETTKIIIAQRISSIMTADRIIVLEDGTINGIGTHDELMKNNEIYRDIFISQQKGAA
ncbi:MAG: ABC transporter ATP-binding protein [Alphaproteobacteria bacterium]|nr:ABC transporter ATP-binding protein [Alphaproteobacteria bacterium]